MTDSAHLPDRRVVVTAIGVTQILGWGATFYLISVLAPSIARDTGWTYARVVAGISVALLVAGLVSPRVGRFIAIYGGRPVLAVGAFLIAAGLVSLGTMASYPVYLASWALIGAGMGAGLYDAAFSTLGAIYGANARRAIGAITMFGGFASTVCWPLSAYLVDSLGWRETCLVYAVMQIVIAVPLHLLVLPRGRRVAPAQNDAPKPPVHLVDRERLIFALLAAVVTIGSSFLSIFGTHLLPLLQARGIDLALAVTLGALIGPAQVGARLFETLAGHRYHPSWTMVASATLLAISAVMLFTGLPVVALAIVLYGAGNGIGTVARGALPLAVFGADRYPVLMGRLALPILIAMAMSPYLSGLVLERGGAHWTFAILTMLGAANVALAVTLRVLITRRVR